MKLNLKSETAAAIVAGASFIASAGHIVHVVDETNPIWFSLVYPIGIDGLIFVGIRAIQSGRKIAGSLALLIGAAYSLLFNAHAEDAIQMDRLLIASSMPICMFAAFLIEATASKTEETETVAPAPAPVALPAQVVTQTIAPAFVPRRITWVGAGARHELPIIPLHAPKPVRVKATVAKTEAPKAIAAKSSGPGRPATWDVEKAVRLLLDGRTNAEVAEMVGTNEKAIQRTNRAVRIVQTDPSTTDESIAGTVGQSVGHIARVRAAI